MEEENTYAYWLNDRYPFDSEARDKSLEAKVLEYLKPKEDLQLLDVGAGTGSNTLYLMDKIKSNQHWYLVEQDASFKSVFFRRVEDYATFHKYEWNLSNNTIQVSTPTKKLSFEFIEGSLLEIAELMPLENIDLVLANAVFDLFSKQQIQQFLTPILQKEIACYFTLNYKSQSFHPEDPFDTTYLSLYDEHMERPQVMGTATGKMVGPSLVDCLETFQTVEQAISTWQIQKGDIKMHYYLLSFMENALQELNLQKEVKTLLPKWIQRKKDLVITRQLELRVEHWDIFSYPKPNE